MENKLVAFGKEEFACYQGATPFSNGDTPLVMYVSEEICKKISKTISGDETRINEITLVCSGESAELMWWDGEEIGAGRTWEGEQLSKNVAFMISEASNEEELYLWLVTLLAAN